MYSERLGYYMQTDGQTDRLAEKKNGEENRRIFQTQLRKR